MKKYRLMIVDDEYLVRMGMKETIDWENLNIEVVADCSNGAEAYDAVHALHPDVIVCDVRMPVMDGLELAQKLYDENFDGVVIMYSGFKDFEYARKAISCGVSDYILKPINNEEFTKTVRRALSELEEKRSSRMRMSELEAGLPIIREKLLESLLDGTGDDQTAAKLHAVGCNVPQSGLVVYCRMLSGKDDDAFKGLFDSISKALEQFDNVTAFAGDSFYVITSLSDTGVVARFISGELDCMQKSRSCRVACGISGSFTQAGQISEAYKKAKARSERAILPFLNYISADGEPEKAGKDNYKLVRDAMDIIVSDYSKKLSVKKVAQRLYVSESHLMHEFKDVAGKTFNECLTEYRISKSCELLSEGGMSVNEIAYKVGYTDVRYFSQVFRDIVGMTPTEFSMKGGTK